MRKWIVAQLDKAEALRLSESMDIPMLLSVLLCIRGFTDEEKIASFLSNEPVFHDPFLIKDMDKATDRIRKAIDNFEKICVYGDYDADGVTATALLYSYLDSVGANVTYYIPSRAEEGYGMNTEAITQLFAQGVSLIVTVDNGISAYDEIAYAKSLGVDTVVTDHHTVPEVIPEAVAVVDLHQDDCPSTFKELSGVGVALKLVMALEEGYSDTEDILDNFADLAALGTIGDVVSLTDENRAIVKEGIRLLQDTDRIGIRELIRSAGYEDKPLTAGTLAYTIVPRINAVGRLGLSSRSVELLLTEDDDIARKLAQELSADNQTRQQIEKDILAEIDERIKNDPALTMQSIIIIDGDNWHQGVIGIVAARVKSAFGKPCIVISREGDSARASGRSVEGFSLSDAIFNCSDLLEHFGGHPMAVGFSLKCSNIEKFKEALYAYTDSLEDMPLPELYLDCKLNPTLLDLSLLDSISALEPFGAGNPAPLFGLYNMRIDDIKELSGGKHRKLTVSREGTHVTAMCFGVDVTGFSYNVGDVVDLAVSLDKNFYSGNTYLSIIVRDIKLSATDNEAQLKSERIYERFCTGRSVTVEDARSILPDRNDFTVVYRFLRSSSGYSGAVDMLSVKLGIPLGKLRTVLTAMCELRLIDMLEGMNKAEISLCQVDGKVSLDSAPIIEELREVCK
ncbi:MAG: single-stranded-DNA-specific exonuclease RecJ [Ruminococcus sp.]|nr:single-stranded-DNA-specific exonuclease RecJ [Ruminococcus sp.]